MKHVALIGILLLPSWGIGAPNPYYRPDWGARRARALQQQREAVEMHKRFFSVFQELSLRVKEDAPLKSMNALRRMVEAYAVGSRLRFEVWRDGRHIVPVTLESRR